MEAGGFNPSALLLNTFRSRCENQMMLSETKRWTEKVAAVQEKCQECEIIDLVQRQNCKLRSGTKKKHVLYNK